MRSKRSALFVFVLLLVCGIREVLSAAARAGSPADSSPPRPNVVLILADESPQTIDNTGGFIRAYAGGQVQLAGAGMTITGGTLDGSGVIRTVLSHNTRLVEGTGQTWDGGVTLEVMPRSTLNLQAGTFTNNATLLLNDTDPVDSSLQGHHESYVQIDGDVTIEVQEY